MGFPKRSDHLAAIEFSDKSAELPCPQCGTSLLHAQVGPAKAIACSTCRGLLLAGEEFSVVVQLLRHEYRGPVEVPRPLDHAAEHPQRSCPTCGELMDVHPYGGPGNAIIDACRICQMVWLDHTELASIVKAPGRR